MRIPIAQIVRTAPKTMLSGIANSTNNFTLSNGRILPTTQLSQQKLHGRSLVAATALFEQYAKTALYSNLSQKFLTAKNNITIAAAQASQSEGLRVAVKNRPKEMEPSAMATNSTGSPTKARENNLKNASHPKDPTQNSKIQMHDDAISKTETSASYAATNKIAPSSINAMQEESTILRILEVHEGRISILQPGDINTFKKTTKGR